MQSSIGIDRTKLMRDVSVADAARLGFLFIGGRHDAEDLLLVRPDQHPDVEQHDGAEPSADADESLALLRTVNAFMKLLPRYPGAGQPGDHAAQRNQSNARGAMYLTMPAPPGPPLSAFAAARPGSARR